MYIVATDSPGYSTIENGEELCIWMCFGFFFAFCLPQKSSAEFMTGLG